MTFKEGLRLGIRLTRAKAYIENARDAKRLGDDTMAELYMGFAKDWNDLARNAGRSLHRPRLTTPNNLLLILVTSKCRNIYQSYHIN
jgi:hypothetical protein